VFPVRPEKKLNIQKNGNGLNSNCRHIFQNGIYKIFAGPLNGFFLKPSNLDFYIFTGISFKTFSPKLSIEL